MKINKAIFSTCETFAPNWNLQSKVYRAMGIEPVCLLFGKKENTDMNEEHGKIIEMPIDASIPLLIQITWSKFFWPTLEPDTTWIIGDIDLYPLQKKWFIDQIVNVPDHHYVHLDAEGITRLQGQPSWIGAKKAAAPMADASHWSSFHGIPQPSPIPGHYHVARGDIFKIALEQHLPFLDECRAIIAAGIYGCTRGFRPDNPIEQHNLWCAEEHRSSAALHRSVQSGLVEFTGFGMTGPQRFDGERNVPARPEYFYGPEMTPEGLAALRRGDWVDVHAGRPFNTWMNATEKLLTAAGML